MAKILFIIPIFIIWTCWLMFLARIVSDSAQESVAFPTSFEDLVKLSKLFQNYYEGNQTLTILFFSSAYVYKQAFCIPGSAFLNLLGGAVFGFPLALSLCCILTALGASLAFVFSKLFAEEYVKYYWPKQIEVLKDKITRNLDSHMFYLLSLRLLPFTPNWLLNLMSPLVGIHLTDFILTVFIGLIPYNFTCVQAGAMIATISSLDDVLTWTVILQFSLFALAAFLMPRLIKGRLKNLI